MRRLRAVLVLALAALVLAGCAAQPIPHARSHHGVFVGQDLSLKTPDDWELRAGLHRMVLMALSPVGKDNQQFRENLAVMAQALNPGESAREFADRNLQAARAALKDFREVAQGEEAGRPWAVYSHVYAGQTLKVLACFVTHQEKGVILVFTSSEGEFPTLEPVFREVARTLSFEPADRDRLKTLQEKLNKADEEKAKLPPQK
ncbi:MAG: hypothetical protein AB1758_07690 [Candidatus Eremiobacterota bacterium]